MGKSKEPVRLRRRKMPSGNISLYLDIYVDGKRSYEYLHLYLVPEVTRDDKEKNRETLRLADAVRAKRVIEVRNGVWGFKVVDNEPVKFFDYYRQMCEDRHGNPASQGNWGNWYSALRHLMKYEPNENITFDEITPEWVEGFRQYLINDAVAWGNDYRKRIKDHPLSQNSKTSYFNKLRACIRQAVDEEVAVGNPLRGIEGIPAEEGTRMYLTIDELRKLVETECEYPKIKSAFLFSCLTGMRRSDVVRLTWGDVFEQGGFTRIIFKQKKTKGQEYLDITEQAAQLMGKRGDADDVVFPDIHSPSCTNEAIKRWVLRAGINKTITFHCARHTFATMMLDIGTDIYTVSKLLGHRELSTTQIYAKVMDKNKQAAVASIPDILSFSNDNNDEG